VCFLSPCNNLTPGRTISPPHPIYFFILFLVNPGTGTTKGSFARRKRSRSNSTTCRRPRCPCPHPPSSRRRRPRATLTCGGCEKISSARIRPIGVGETITSEKRQSAARRSNHPPRRHTERLYFVPFSVFRTGRLCSLVRALVLRAPPPPSTPW
jgi:hypothetical protein